MTDWICPDVTTFELLNNPETYNYGKSFRLVIDFCDPSATTGTCITDETQRKDFLKLITVQSKVVSQYFSPSTYQDSKQLAYSSSEQMNSGLISNSCIVKSFNVYLHQLRVFDSKTYDLSSLTTLDFSKRFNRYSFNFWNTIPKPYTFIEGKPAESTGFY